MLKSASSQSIVSLGSGALTPALSFTGAANFADDAKARRRLSIGLDDFIEWHEGRADLRAVIEEMMAENHGTISVNACGPKSLLESAKGIVRELSSVRRALEGGSCVDFHAETFGW
jgi:hypothetical protein